MVALADLVDLLCRLSASHPQGVNTWIVTGGVDYSTRDIYDLLREAAGKGRGRAWWPRWAWRLGAWLFDRVRGDNAESTWDKLFGTERYSHSAVLAATDWRPRWSLQDLAASMMAGPGKAA
jgi:nucleoside-diphosphate-sugar epimerase